jgi:hypothetical protein
MFLRYALTREIYMADGSASPGVASGPDGAAADARLSALAASLATRLRAACADWDAGEFDALVERIARTKLRWADRGYGE